MREPYLDCDVVLICTYCTVLSEHRPFATVQIVARRNQSSWSSSMLVIDCCVSVHACRIVCLLSSPLVDHGIFIKKCIAVGENPNTLRNTLLPVDHSYCAVYEYTYSRLL